ncbi:MAG: hypothetical protein AAB937_01390 [Patescibacteria group bacterium]
MNKKPNSLIYIVAAVGLIIVGIVTTAIINAVKNTNQSGGTDIRARAAVTNTLKLTGIVSEVIDLEGMLIVSNVQFADTSRSGTAKDYGTWKVFVPTNFALITATVGSTVTFNIDAKSFNVTTKSVVASQITVGK